MWKHRLAQGHNSLFHPWDGPFEHNKVIFDLAIANKAAQAESQVSQSNIQVARDTYGVICFLVASNSVEALDSLLPFPIL